jgi:hypothetical protein
MHKYSIFKSLLKTSICLLVFLGLSFEAGSFSVTLKGVGLGRFVGHEEVSRQAIIMTKKLAEKQGYDLSSELLDEMTDIRKRPMGLESVISKNPLVVGNRAADQPDGDGQPVNIRATLGYAPKEIEPSLLKWGGARSFHFTLNEYEAESFKNGKPKPTVAGVTEGDYTYDTPKEACEYARDKITLFTHVGMKALSERAKINSSSRANRVLRKELLRKALFSFGVATHVIQDSFSPSHTFRAPHQELKSVKGSSKKIENFDLVDVCYYDQVIHHIVGGAVKTLKSVATQDWDSADKLILSPEERMKDFVDSSKPCAHRKNDLDDYIWMRTAKQKAMLDSGNWEKLDSEILNDEDVKKSGTSKKIKKMGLLKFCQSERRFSSNSSAFACIKQESRLARTATIKYFMVLLKHIKNIRSAGAGDIALTEDENKKSLETLLMSSLFSGSEIFNSIETYGLNKIMSKGIMRCSKLTDRRYTLKSDGSFNVKNTSK